jgi:hypothetical protein
VYVNTDFFQVGHYGKGDEGMKKGDGGDNDGIGFDGPGCMKMLPPPLLEHHAFAIPAAWAHMRESGVP